MEPETERADVAVIGAGIIGCAIGLRLAQSATDVVILERLPTIGRGASGTNAGTVSFQVNKMYTWSSYPFPIDLCVESQRVWASVQSELGVDIDYERTGGLRIAKTEEELQFLRAVVRDERGRGLEVELLTGDEARRIEPVLSHAVLGASYLASDGRANAYLTTRAFAEAAERAGARRRMACEVKDIELGNRGRVTLRTTQGLVQCSTVVVAAGLGTRELAEQVGLKGHFRVKTNQACVTEALPPLLTRVVTSAGRALSLRQLRPGNVLIGGGWDGIPANPPRRPQVHLSNLAKNVGDACAAIPALGTASIIRAWAASDIRLEDQLPLLGPLPSDQRVLFAVGDKVGFTLAPLIGHIMGELILTGRSSMPISRFGAERFDSSHHRR